MLDSVVALFVVFTVLAIAVFFMSRAEQTPVSDLQASRLGNDIFAVLDYRGVLRDFNLGDIRNELDSMLPEGYLLEYKIECQTRVYDSRRSSTFDDEPTFSGERIFIDDKYNKCIARYWVWLN